jgi:hypothetical protein
MLTLGKWALLYHADVKGIIEPQRKWWKKGSALNRISKNIMEGLSSSLQGRRPVFSGYNNDKNHLTGIFLVLISMSWHCGSNKNERVYKEEADFKADYIYIYMCMKLCKQRKIKLSTRS